MVERRRAGEQRRGVTVGTEPEVDDVDRVAARAPARRTRRPPPRPSPRRRPSSRAPAAARAAKSTRRIMPSFESGSSTGTNRSSPMYTSVSDQSMPARRQRGVASSAVEPPDSAIDGGSACRDQVGERLGDVVDLADLAGERHGVLQWSSSSWPRSASASGGPQLPAS